MSRGEIVRQKGISLKTRVKDSKKKYKRTEHGKNCWCGFLYDDPDCCNKE